MKYAESEVIEKATTLFLAKRLSGRWYARHSTSARYATRQYLRSLQK